MKYLLTLAFAAFILINCNDRKSTVPTENEKLGQQYFKHFNNHDWKKTAEMYTETAEFKDPSLGKGIVKQSKQQIIDKYTALNQMFPDVKDKIIKIYTSGDSNIIVEFVSTGTAPDNTTFELPICTIFTIENGKITKDFTYFDNFE
ncbi:Ketosteroid isomerase-related protein [Chryseobacterium taeanense]|uniref:Ketosteroid isomerase-related protein n=1 Tax=Chryseobacterium taeanense TaxID=311334 RepID=A0A1G8L8S6_9FLAO|nr:nuclear transport factor 2 family protein [Chryseobacterium taeanense]SDI52063.1 Ketosteroid isomerase-related protein [Chryseobacterium taeanense]